MIPYKGENLPQAREMRREMTGEEKHLWYDFLRFFPYRFQRQKALGPFIADFYCHAARLVVEVDGMQHDTEQGKAYDAERTAFLQQYDIEVIRFKNTEVNTQFAGVCEAIAAIVDKRVKTIPPSNRTGPHVRKRLPKKSL